ncbi:uncharacterized protein LOC132706504 [Cylas formicarius]|uniref:uncharacterized protein LOC132706504 n=1 Tax=Cylas formicarius TaxID=197179 RepID=UPI002958976B|nr:uncharacterized protein LOC132706504 [Cylas formicarius]
MFTLCMSRSSPPLQDNCNKNSTRKKQIKGGYLLRYKKGFFCKAWCEEWVVLYEDSTLAWFADKSLSRPRGFVRISDAPDLLAVGEWTRQVPRRPRLSKACHFGQLLAVGCRRMHQIHWLMAATPAEINDWMTAISNTLPPPPQLPLEDKRVALMHHQQDFPNGRAAMVPNGVCNGNCPSEDAQPKAVSRATNNHINKPRKEAATKRNYDNDHTVIEGVVIDWGHGWGWSQEVATHTSYIPDTTTTISSTVFCHSAEDYNMGGYDDIDWSAFGDFCF